MIGFLVFGLVVGFLARLIVPGRQHVSLWMTLLLGLLGSVALEQETGTSTRLPGR